MNESFPQNAFQKNPKFEENSSRCPIFEVGLAVRDVFDRDYDISERVPEKGRQKFCY